MLKAPCKNCEERHTRCHSSCEKYKKYREEMDKLAEKKRKEYLETEFFVEHRRGYWQ